MRKCPPSLRDVVDTHAAEMHCRSRYLLLQQLLRNMRRPLSSYTHFENVPDHISCDLIHDPVMLIVWVFELANGWVGAQRFARFALCLEPRANLLTGVFGAPFIR